MEKIMEYGNIVAMGAYTVLCGVCTIVCGIYTVMLIRGEVE